MRDPPPSWGTGRLLSVNPAPTDAGAWPGAGGVAQPKGVSALGARQSGAREGLPLRGGGAGASSSLTAPAREFQFET